jgi:hypothetical protein
LTFTTGEPANPSKRENNGEDETRPLTRFDLRPRYERLSSGRDAWRLTLRAEHPFDLGNHWQFAVRFDAPLDVKNISTTDTEYKAGLSDFFIQGLLIDQLDDRNAFGIGGRIIFPTATQDDLGAGKWQLVPTVAYRYMLDEVSRGSFFVALVRYQVDVAGDGQRPHVSQLQLGPIVNVQLPERSFVTLWSAADITYDFRSNRWFVPVDVTVGKKLARGVVTSVEVETPIVRDLDLYRLKIEARVSFFL